MKKYAVAMALYIFSLNTQASDEQQIDMSDPTDAYTSIGIGYSNEGTHLKFMAMLSTSGDGKKEAFIVEAHDIFDESGEDQGKFSGLGVCKDGRTGACFDDSLKNRNFRFRWGSLSTRNGLGTTVDAVIKDHPFFGQMSIIQAGALATVPVGDSTIFWPMLLAGGVIIEDNMQQLNASTTPIKSSGIDWASTVFSTKLYVRHKFTDSLWFLGSWTYTDEMKGKSWSSSVKNGGLGIGSTQFEGVLGYQLTPKQNIAVKYFGINDKGSSDRITLEYNYAF